MAEPNISNSLIKIDAPVTSKYGSKQTAIYAASGMIIAALIFLVMKFASNIAIVVPLLVLILAIVAVVASCARSNDSLYNTEVRMKFWKNNKSKEHEIYKFDPATTTGKAAKFTGLQGIDLQGRLKFNRCKVYDKSYCTHGFCYIVTPSDSSDVDSFYVGIENLLKSLPSGVVHKTVAAQSKHLVNLAAEYEERLKNPNLPVMVRNGLNAKKRFFENIKNRVGWMHVIFIGVEYLPNDEESNERIDEVMDLYEKSLQMHGIQVEVVRSPTEYATIYSQMSRMESLEGLL